MRWILAALATAIGAGGWAFAIFFMLSADDIESELTAAQAELSTLSDEFERSMEGIKTLLPIWKR